MSRRRQPNALEQRLDVRTDYDAMFESRFVRTRTGLAPMGGGADYHIRNETRYLKLIEMARDMERNDSIIGKTIERAAINVVQDGFTLCPETGDDALDRAIFDRWQDWATDREQCDVAGESCWHEMEQLAVHSMLRDGDILGLGTADGPLQMIESHRVRNPGKTKADNRNIIIGVEVDDLHRRIRYHIRPESWDPQQSTQKMTSQAYDVRDEKGVRQVFHFYQPNRSSATRGLTALAPVFQIAGMFEDLNFAKLVQAQVVSCFALFRYQEASSPSSDILPSVQAYGVQTTENQGDGTTRLIDDLAPGVELTGKPGERLEGFSPDVPNTNYFEHAKLLLSMIAVNLGMPYSMLMLDSSGNSWSAVRVDYDEARRGFKRIQQSLIERWHEPIYLWKLRHFAAEDPAMMSQLVRLGRRFFRHQWRPPTWPYVQPVDDATGQLLRVRNGLTSPRRLHGELSQDWEEIAAETVADNAIAIKTAMAAAEQINATRGEQSPVHWRELLSLPTPDGLTLTMPVATSSTPQQPQQQEPS